MISQDKPGISQEAKNLTLCKNVQKCAKCAKNDFFSKEQFFAFIILNDVKLKNRVFANYVKYILYIFFT